MLLKPLVVLVFHDPSFHAPDPSRPAAVSRSEENCADDEQT